MLPRFLEFLLAMKDELGLTWGMIIAGSVGAMLSLASIDPSTRIMGYVTTVLAGIAISWFGTPAVGTYLEITKIPVLTGIALINGLFGLAVIKEVSDIIRTGGLRSVLTFFSKSKGHEK